MSSSFSAFKNNLSKFFNYPLRNYLFYVWDRTTSIHHTRPRLNLSALNHDLFKMICAVSSVCNFYNAPTDDAKHFFLHCSGFAQCSA